MKKKSVTPIQQLQRAPIHPALPPDKLRWQCNPRSLGVRTTDNVQPIREIIGQERALRALRVGLEMNHFGYNIFVTGISGTGRTTTIKRLLQDFEKQHVELQDQCYVYNFKIPTCRLPSHFPLDRAPG